MVQELALTQDEAARWRVMPYIDRMGEALAAADLVLSRAGASSVAEIAALAVPSMLVPYPFATADHQTTNARYLVDAGAAVLLPDEKIDTSEFEDDLLGLVDDPARRQAMRDAARGLAQDKAALALADQVERTRRPSPSPTKWKVPRRSRRSATATHIALEYGKAHVPWAVSSCLREVTDG